MLQRNESQFIKHAIPYSQHHRSRSRNRHFHRPISLSRPAIHLFHTPINDSPILECVRARSRLLRHISAIRSTVFLVFNLYKVSLAPPSFEVIAVYILSSPAT
ncbi:hypothetical protein SLE2022_336930 [Rubroshorea leprosula]